MLDHIGIPVSDVARSVAFYKLALTPIGVSVVMEVAPATTGDGGRHVGFGSHGKPYFWIGNGAVGGSAHVAFATRSRAEVDEFYQTAIIAGGRDNGAPGLRPHYHADYYGAFVLDPDGHNIEAVCHAPG